MINTQIKKTPTLLERYMETAESACAEVLAVNLSAHARTQWGAGWTWELLFRRIISWKQDTLSAAESWDLRMIVEAGKNPTTGPYGCHAASKLDPSVYFDHVQLNRLLFLFSGYCLRLQDHRECAVNRNHQVQRLRDVAAKLDELCSAAVRTAKHRNDPNVC